ncbi:hypothetical protein M8C21_014588 [Ambrosia artemisiifolia]|uniref:Agenet domain-containing protein n=1 Tax=Ambrosia artemisiifolia TaxID=4212 RepID=A0AAD5CMT6_AMBAR|nr:hypothetical protein M8C21_014588 [Ambrosia artemisiifolia]
MLNPSFYTQTRVSILIITGGSKVYNKMDYKRGDKVEVVNNEEGFKGSFFPANIISKVSDNEYIVQYRTLVKDDNSGPLREVLSAKNIRPAPREIVASGFRLSESVDAYVEDGWWAAKVVGKSGSDYVVRFDNECEEKTYPLDLLRVHQDWKCKDGVWVFSGK